LKLFNIFRNKWTAFYHEDDYLQIEILPCENSAILEDESDRVDAFSKENFDGQGLTDMYVRNSANKVELSQRAINISDLEIILSSMGMDRTEKVVTGYGQSYRISHNNCIAYGKEYHVIYFDFEGEIVQHIWITQPWLMNQERLIDCLYNLGLKWDLLLQDWNLLETIDLKNKKAIIDYLKLNEE